MLSQSEVFKILKAVREGKARRVEDVYALVAVENRDLDVMFSFFISYYIILFYFVISFLFYFSI